MKDVAAQLITAQRRSHDIHGQAFVVAEWNFNKTIEATVENGPDNVESSINKKYFPLSSLLDSHRPKSGIYKAFTNGSYTSDSDFTGDRYYVVSENDTFKYWISPKRSDALTLDGSHAIIDCEPSVIYNENVDANKITVGFNLEYTPKNFTVHTYNGTVWSQVATLTNEDLSLDGTVSIWWNGTTWQEEQVLSEDVSISLRGVKIIVTSTVEPNAHVSLLDLSARREIDITERVTEYAVEMSMDETDFIYPVGTISSNGGSLGVNNYDEILNSASLSKLLNRLTEFRLYVKYDLTNEGLEDPEYVKIATMFANMWKSNEDYSYDIELFDIAKALQTIKCPVMLCENRSLVSIITQILDSVGHSEYIFNYEDYSEDAIIEYFWTDGEEDVWSVLARLCMSTQSAIFVNSDGFLEIVTKDYIANDEEEVDWTFLAENDGLDIAEVISISPGSEIAANDVTIRYKKYKTKADQLDVTQQSLTTSVWEPDDTIVLRAGKLQRTIPASGLTEDIWVDWSEAESWPFSGKINIDGEIFEYKGKGYKFYDYNVTPPVYDEVLVYSDDERRQIDRTTYEAYTRNQNYAGTENLYTGRLRMIKRDLNEMGSQIHSKDIKAGWYFLDMWHRTPQLGANKWFWPGTNSTIGDWTTKTNWTDVQRKWSWGSSILTVNNGYDPANLRANMAIKELPGLNYTEFGTKIKFHNASSSAGIVANISTTTTGESVEVDPINGNPAFAYLFQVVQTERTEISRADHHEILGYIKTGDVITRMWSFETENGWRGLPVDIQMNQWYDFEVSLNIDYWKGQRLLMAKISINGQYVGTLYTDILIGPTNWAGVWADNSAHVSFEHFFAASSEDYYKSVDDHLYPTTGSIVNLPAGTNLTKIINLPTDTSFVKYSTLSLASSASCTIHKIDFLDYQDSNTLPRIRKTYNNMSLAAFKRPHWDISRIPRISHYNVSAARINYTSTAEISVCVEGTMSSMPYESEQLNFPNDHALYSVQNGGYISSYLSELTNIDSYSPTNTWSYDMTSIGAPRKSVFYDDFGSIIHEIRDFEVILDKSPAKSVNVYSSNPLIDVVEININPVKGTFTLANASRKNEIVHGTEQVTESESIEQTLMLYGYVIEEKSEEEKNVKNMASQKAHGLIELELDAEWIQNDAAAEALADWIAEHWGEPKNELQLETFNTSFIELADKAKVKSSIVDADFIYIVARLSVEFSEGLKTNVTLRRIK